MSARKVTKRDLMLIPIGSIVLVCGLLTVGSARADGDNRIRVAIGGAPDGQYRFEPNSNWRSWYAPVIEGELAYGRRFCKHLELGAAYVYGRLPGVVHLHRIPLTARLFIMPSDAVELGLALRVGPLLGYRTPIPGYQWPISDPFPGPESDDGTRRFAGWAIGGAFDARAWADDHLGATLAVEYWRGSGRVDGLHTTFHTVNAASVTVGAVVRF